MSNGESSRSTPHARLADKIIADYLAHCSFPWQGESHMRDCIMDALTNYSASDAAPSDGAFRQVLTATLRAAAEFPITDGGNLDAINIRALCRAMLEVD